jgi:hypothetical protein
MTDQQPWIVKFSNNPNGLRNLPNELIAGRLAQRLGVKAPKIELAFVSQELIDAQNLRFRNGGAVPAGGPCFASKTVAGVDAIVVPAASPDPLTNRDVASIAVFQTWTGNGDGQAIFRVQSEGVAVYSIDHGHFFGAPNWDESIAARRESPSYTLHLRQFVAPMTDVRLYEEPLSRLELLTVADMAADMRDVPQDWLTIGERAALITFLRNRQGQVRAAIDRFIEGAA